MAASASANCSLASTFEMPVSFTASGPGASIGAFGAFHALVARRQEQRRRLCSPVDDEDRARHLDAGQVEELVALAKLEVAGTLRRALQDGDAVADLGHQPRTARREFLGRKRVGEERPGRRRHQVDHEADQDDRNALHKVTSTNQQSTVSNDYNSRMPLVAVLVLIALLAACSSPNPSQMQTPMQYPPAEKGPVVDTCTHGTKVPDPYRWLEDADAPETVKWVEAQNRLTQQFVDGPARGTVSGSPSSTATPHRHPDETR